MKNQILSLIGAVALAGFASSCQSDEPAVNNGEGLTTISVNIPTAEPNSRAVPEIPEGYKLRCIMQLVDGSGAAIADARYVNEVTPGSESVNFTFIAPSDGYQGAMFWADYVKDIENDFIYTTTDLKAVGYNTVNAAEAFNNPAADAFYGYMLADQKNITLARPFTRISFKSADASYDGYTKVKVTDMAAPTSFNVINGNTADYATGLASNELTVGEDGSWFSAYLFVGNNAGGNLGAGHNIALTLDGTTNITISGENIPLTRNYDITALISATSGDVTDVTVTFPGGMIDPNAPRDIAVGDFVNADGSYSEAYDATKAVAIVYALADANTVENGKTVAAYAFALENAGRLVVDQDKNATAFAGTEAITAATYDDAAGPAAWAVFEGIAGANNNMVKLVADYASAHTLTGSNLSAWYVGSASQMKTMVGHLFNGEGWTLANGSKLEVEFPARIDAVYNAYQTVIGADGYFTHNNTTANFLSSAIGVATTDNGAEGKIACVQVSDEKKTFGALVSGLTGTCAVRPMISIYK